MAERLFKSFDEEKSDEKLKRVIESYKRKKDKKKDREWKNNLELRCGKLKEDLEKRFEILNLNEKEKILGNSKYDIYEKLEIVRFILKKRKYFGIEERIFEESDEERFKMIGRKGDLRNYGRLLNFYEKKENTKKVNLYLPFQTFYIFKLILFGNLLNEESVKFKVGDEEMKIKISWKRNEVEKLIESCFLNEEDIIDDYKSNPPNFFFLCSYNFSCNYEEEDDNFIFESLFFCSNKPREKRLFIKLNEFVFIPFFGLIEKYDIESIMREFIYTFYVYNLVYSKRLNIKLDILTLNTYKLIRSNYYHIPQNKHDLFFVIYPEYILEEDIKILFSICGEKLLHELISKHCQKTFTKYEDYISLFNLI